jgi:SIR2-like protein
MQLVKLHGSVNWIRNKAREIEEREYHLNYDQVTRRSGSKDILEDIIIYPLSQKHLYFTPFIQLFRILGAELSKRDFWIIIGYSFRDVIIRNMFERALAENEKRKMLLVHPHATEQIKPIFQEQVRDQLTCLDRYFAKRNYSHVNIEIAQALSNLANA